MDSFKGVPMEPLPVAGRMGFPSPACWSGPCIAVGTAGAVGDGGTRTVH